MRLNPFISNPYIQMQLFFKFCFFCGTVEYLLNMFNDLDLVMFVGHKILRGGGGAGG